MERREWKNGVDVVVEGDQPVLGHGSTSPMREVGRWRRRRSPSTTHDSSLGQSHRNPRRHLSKTPGAKLGAIRRAEFAFHLSSTHDKPSATVIDSFMHTFHAIFASSADS